MRLAAAATYFDKTPCIDAYGSGATFYGQLDLYDDSKREGLTTVRRVLSVAPGTQLPPRRTILIDGDPWLVGDTHKDTYGGPVIRERYVLHKAEGLATVKTVAQVLSSGGTQAYAGTIWVKDFKEIEVGSDVHPYFQVFFARGESVAVGQVIVLGSDLYYVRGRYDTAVGFLAAEAEQMADDALVAGTYRSYSLNPVTDAASYADTLAVQILRMRFQTDFQYPTQASEKMEPGDQKARVLRSVIASAKEGDRVVTSDGTRLVVGVLGEDPLTWTLHLRNA